MKKLTVLLAGLGIATAAIPTANAATFAPDNRAQTIQMRIDQGIRSGALDRREAFRLQNELRDVRSLEFRYARSGGRIDMRERADLNRRYDVLSAKLRFEKHDRDGRGHGRRW